MLKNKVIIGACILTIILGVGAYFGYNKYYKNTSKPRVQQNSNSIENKNINLKSEFFKLNHVEIEFPYENIYQPCVAGDFIYTAAGKNGGQLDRLVAYNVKTKEIKELFKSEFERSMIQGLLISKDNLLFVDTNDVGDKYVFYIMNLTNNKIEKIEKKDFEYTAMDVPVINDNYVAWVTKDNNVSKIILFDLNSKEKKVIATLNDPNFYNNFLSFKGDKLLWTDSEKNVGYYKIYNLKTKNIDVYESKSFYPGYAEIINDNIYSLDFVDSRDWSTNKLTKYNLITKESKQLSDSYVDKIVLAKDYYVVFKPKNQIEFYNYKDERIQVDSTNMKPNARQVFVLDGYKLIYALDGEENVNKVVITTLGVFAQPIQKELDMSQQ